MGLLSLLATGAPTYDTLAVVGERTGLSSETTWATEGGTATGRSLHTVKAACQSIRLRYTNTYEDAWTMSAAVEVEGVVVPATFGGEASVTVAPGAIVETDPINVGTLTAGTTLPVRTRYTTEAGQSRPWARVTNLVSPVEGVTEGANLTTTGSGAVNSSGSSYGTIPHAILGLTTTPPTSIALLGDSISEWGNDNAERVRGFAARAFDAAGVAWSNLAHWGYATGDFVNVDSTTTPTWTSHYGTSWLNAYTHVLSALGRNDFASDGRTVQQRHDRAIALWRRIGIESNGAALAVTTTTPIASSTDLWATLVNQTPEDSDARRAPYNAWLRDGAPLNATTFAAVTTGGPGVRIGEEGHPVTALIDVAATVEDGGSSAPTGKWTVVAGDDPGAFGMDGTHPGPARHALMRDAVANWLTTL